MVQTARSCPKCGQLFSEQPVKCEHCGHRFRRFADRGRLSDLVPVFRLLPYRLRQAIMLFAAFLLFAYAIDLVTRLDELHTFMNRRGLPRWARR